MKEAPPRPTISWLRWCGLSLGVFFALLAILFGIAKVHGWMHPEMRIRPEAMAIYTALDAYRLNTGALPTEDQREIFRALTNPSGPAKRIFIEWPAELTTQGGRFLDPWGRPYVFKFNGPRITILSAGRDGTIGGGDDIVGADR